MNYFSSGAHNRKLQEINQYEKNRKEIKTMNEGKTKIILRNDPAKKQQVNFAITRELHLDIKDLHTMEERKRNKKIKLADFQAEVMAKGVREWLNK